MQSNRTKNSFFSLSILIALCGAEFTLAGCGSDYDQPTDEEYDEIARSVAPILAQDASKEDGTAQVLIQLGSGTIPVWLSGQAEGELSGTLGGLRWDVAYGCQDRAGVDQAICNAESNSAEVHVEVDGNVMLGANSISASVRGDWSLSGILEPEVTTTADADAELHAEWVGLLGDKHVFTISTGARYDLVIPKAQPLATRGNVSASLDITKETSGKRSARFLVAADVELLGNGSARLVLDGSLTFMVDTVSGAVTRM